MMELSLRRRSLVRTNAPPLPGLTCWNSTMIHSWPSITMASPFFNSLVEIIPRPGARPEAGTGRAQYNPPEAGAAACGSLRQGGGASSPPSSKSPRCLQPQMVAERADPAHLPPADRGDQRVLAKRFSRINVGHMNLHGQDAGRLDRVTDGHTRMRVGRR